jgi:predicted RNA polymerase sigma factor
MIPRWPPSWPRVNNCQVPEPVLWLLAALAIVDGLDLVGYQYWHSTRAELLRRLGRSADARATYTRALTRARSEPERRFLRRRIAES